jgi:hypothetical protein
MYNNNHRLDRGNIELSPAQILYCVYGMYMYAIRTRNRIFIEQIAHSTILSTEMRVFVTVGSTQFDALVTHILSPSFLKLLRECQKVIQVTIQYGRTPLTALVTDEGEFTKSVIQRFG